MARLEFDDYIGQEITRVYIAGRLKEAQRVESTLTQHGIDYFVDIERYRKSLLGILPIEYAGAAFFVVPAQVALARSVLLAAGLEAGLEEDEPR